MKEFLEILGYLAVVIAALAVLFAKAKWYQDRDSSILPFTARKPGTLFDDDRQEGKWK